MCKYGQASAPAAKRYVGRRKSTQGKSMENGMGIIANWFTAFRPRGVSASSRWSECLICFPTPKYQFALHQKLLQLHRRSAFLEYNLSPGISSTPSHLTPSSEYSGTTTNPTSTKAFAVRRTNRLFQPGVVADLSRLQRAYRERNRKASSRAEAAASAPGS